MRNALLLAAALTICSAGASAAQSEPYIGSVMIFAGNFCPVGWMPLEGETLPISQYVPLFSLLGTTYGGDGKKNFALPKAIDIKTIDGKTFTQCIAFLGVFPPRN